MSESTKIAIDDAKKLLGLDGKARLDLAIIENAYAEKIRQWSTALNSALTFEDRERAADAIALMNEAKKALSTSLNRTKRPSSWHWGRQGWWKGGSIFSFLKIGAIAQAFLSFRQSVGAWVGRITNIFRQIQRSISVSVQIISAVSRTVINVLVFVAEVLQRLDPRKVAFIIAVIVIVFLYITTKEGSAKMSRNEVQYHKDSPRSLKVKNASSQRPVGHTMLYIRSWPASRVKVNGSKVVMAPARQPVKVKSGKQSFYFIPEDESIKALTVNADLQSNKCMELRVDLETQKCTLRDLGIAN